MFDFIDKIVYINLDSRTDRKEQMERELIIVPTEKIQRFSAIKNSQGAIGCTLSHIAVLEMAIIEGWNNVMIVEDDVQISKLAESYPLLEKLANQPFDVIVLGSVMTNYNGSTFNLHHCQTTTAYLVNKHYYSTLLQNFKEGLEQLQRTHNKPLYAIDMYWQRLQKRDNWYVVIPSLFVQRPSYSDIEQKDVNYTHLFH